MDRVEERRLIQRAQRGEAEAFGQLYRAHVQAIYRYLVHRVNDVQIAEDLTGDVFTRALKDLARYVDQGKPFVAWLYRIAHARVVDHYRRMDRRPQETNVEVEVLTISHDMDEPMIRRQAARVLRQAISELTDDQQQVVTLRFIEGYSINDVALIMQKKPNAIKALQHRALRTLASKLERSGFDIQSILAGLS